MDQQAAGDYITSAVLNAQRRMGYDASIPLSTVEELLQPGDEVLPYRRSRCLIPGKGVIVKGKGKGKGSESVQTATCSY